MLWSLAKVLIFVAIVAGVALGAGALLELDGGMTVQVPATAMNEAFEFTLQPLPLVMAFAALIIAQWLIFKLAGLLVAVLRWINGDETAISRYFDRNRERSGFDALSEALMALASGDGKLALAKAAKADRKLDRPELTGLVTAQAAEMTGDTKKAGEVYKELLQNDKTRFVGVHGLLKQKLADGDTETALKLAEKAFALKPKHVDTQDTLLKLQAGEEDWAGARQTLNAKLKHGALPRDIHKRRDAVMALSEARALRRDGKLEDAQKLSIEANRLSPELIPAATMAARAHVEQGKPKLATKVLKSAWTKQPHPELAAAFAAIEEGESNEARIKRFKALTRAQASDPETKMVMAELYIAAEDFPAARRALGDLVDKDPTVRALTILAAIEKGEGAPDSTVRGLLTRALSAPRDPQWVCDVCGNIQAEWDAACDECGAIDSLSWKRPATGMSDGGTTGAMLPLLSAPPEEDPTPDLPAVEVVEAEILEPGSEAPRAN